jgi:hypothetical protein
MLLHAEAHVAVAADAPAVPVLVYSMPFRFALFVPTAIRSPLVLREQGESFEAYGQRVWAAARPTAHSWMAAGCIPIGIRESDDPATTIRRVMDLTTGLMLVPQGFRTAEDVLAALEDAA